MTKEARLYQEREHRHDLIRFIRTPSPSLYQFLTDLSAPISFREGTPKITRTAIEDLIGIAKDAARIGFAQALAGVEVGLTTKGLLTAQRVIAKLAYQRGVQIGADLRRDLEERSATSPPRAAQSSAAEDCSQTPELPRT